MKKLLVSFVFICSLFTTVALAAEPEPMQYTPFWECRASSLYAVGFGYHEFPEPARNIAINECVSRTPYGYFCVVDWCRRVR